MVVTIHNLPIHLKGGGYECVSAARRLYSAEVLTYSTSTSWLCVRSLPQARRGKGKVTGGSKEKNNSIIV